MKCIKNTLSGKITRVKNEIADSQVDSGKWIFVPKKDWKNKVRDAKPESPQAEG